MTVTLETRKSSCEEGNARVNAISLSTHYERAIREDLWQATQRKQPHQDVCDHRYAWHRRREARQEARSAKRPAGGVREDHYRLQKETVVQLTLGRSALKISVSSPRSRTSSSYCQTSCSATTRRWASVSMCYKRFENYRCEDPWRHHDHPRSLWPVTRWFQLDVKEWWRRDYRSSGGGKRPCGIQHEDFPPRTAHSRTMVQARQKMPVRIVNYTKRNHVLAGGNTLDRCEPVMWSAPTDDLETAKTTRGLWEKLTWGTRRRAKPEY